MIEGTTHVGVMYVRIFIPDAHSLKDKRKVVKSIKERARHRWNVSVAEVDGQDKWQRATLVFAAVGADSGRIDEILDHIQSMIECQYAVNICSHEVLYY